MFQLHQGLYWGAKHCGCNIIFLLAAENVKQRSCLCFPLIFLNSSTFKVDDLLSLQTERNAMKHRGGLATNPHLMLITQVCLQVAQPSAVEVAQPALVRFDVIVPHHVQTQVFSTAACESAFVTAEDSAFEIA